MEATRTDQDWPERYVPLEARSDHPYGPREGGSGGSDRLAIFVRYFWRGLYRPARPSAVADAIDGEAADSQIRR